VTSDVPTNFCFPASGEPLTPSSELSRLLGFHTLPEI